MTSCYARLTSRQPYPRDVGSDTMPNRYRVTIETRASERYRRIVHAATARDAKCIARDMARKGETVLAIQPLGFTVARRMLQRDWY